MTRGDLKLSYCSILDGKIIVNDRTLFTDNEIKPEESFLVRAYRALDISYPKFFKMDNLSKTGFLAAELLLRGSLYDNPELKPNTSIILLTRNASLDTDLSFQSTINNPSSYFPSPSIFVYTLPNIVLGEICIRFKVAGEGIVMVEPHINSTLLFDYINMLFNDGRTESCIFGWVDFINSKPDAFIAVIQKKVSFISFNQHSFNSFISRTFKDG
jgi:hypothetical protein